MSDVIYKQEDYYNLDSIKERLSAVLGSDAWENLKKTDLGQNLIGVGANIIHMDAMAFFTGLDQSFKSTVTLSGYLEEIAKSKGIIPKTYVSASITVSLYSNTSVKTFGPLDFSLRVGGETFYNVDDITIGTINDPTTIVLYQGSVVRVASVAGRPAGSSWSFTQFGAVQSEKVGDRVVRKYLILPREVYVDSIVVTSGVSLDVPFLRWNKVDSWYGINQTSRSWKLGKDYLGRYTIEFGDGVYGLEYPTSDIVGVKYLLSKGSGIEISEYTNVKIYNQDVNDVTSDYVVGSLSTVVDGQSEVNLSDLHLEIEAKETTRESLISEDDHKNYLEGRADVLYANVIAERHVDPPNVNYFNRMTYTIKPNSDGGSFNDSDIQAYLGKQGIKTVEYANASVERNNFNVTVQYSVLTGYLQSGIQSQIESILNAKLSWEGLGFDETLSSEKLYALLVDIEGLDLQSLVISVEYIYTNADTGVIIFDFLDNDIIPLKFYPSRFKLYFDSDVLVEGTTARDNGNGSIYGDFPDRERFNYTGDRITANTFGFLNLMMFGTQTDTFSLVDLRRPIGGVSKIKFLSNVYASCWCDRYKEILTVEYVGAGRYRIKAYSFPEVFANTESFNYIQLSDLYEYSKVSKESVSLTPPGVSAVRAITYYDGYAYIVYDMGSLEHRLYRYRVMNGAIEDYDSSYNGTGYIYLGTKEVLGLESMENAFSNGQNVLAILTKGAVDEGGLDIIIDFDIATEAIYEKDFFNVALVQRFGDNARLMGGSYSGGALYISIEADTYSYASVLAKVYSMNTDGTCSIQVLSDNSKPGLKGAVYSIYNSVAEVFSYSEDDYNVYKVGFSDLNEEPEKRAGDGFGNLTSIAKIAEIAYDILEITFSLDITGTIRYESEDDLTFTGAEMPVLHNLQIYSV